MRVLPWSVDDLHVTILCLSLPSGKTYCMSQNPFGKCFFKHFFFFSSLCLHPEIDILSGELSKWTTFGNTLLAWSRTVQFVICNIHPVALYACMWLSCSAWVSLLSRWGKALTTRPSPLTIWKVSVPGDVWCACTFPRCYPQPREMVLFRCLSGELWGRVRWQPGLEEFEQQGEREGQWKYLNFWKHQWWNCSSCKGPSAGRTSKQNTRQQQDRTFSA